MTTLRKILTGACGLGAASCIAVPALAGGLPLKPIGATEYRGWPKSYRLDNGAMELVVVPSVGRIVHASLIDGPNLLRLDDKLAGQSIPEDEAPPFFNLGGDWLWPAAQSRWQALTGADWPPPEFVADRPWSGHAWKTDDGGLHCLIERSYGAPLQVKVTRQISLDPTQARFSIRQRLVRTGESDTPVCLWQISQVAAPDQVFVPVDTSSAFEQGRRIIFGEAGEGTLHQEDDVLIVNTADGGEVKLGTDSPRRWIAARTGDALLMQRANGPAIEGTAADGGCIGELYSNPGLGYAEIESLSVEAVPMVGDPIENTVHVSLHPIATDLDPAALVKRVKELAGEQAGTLVEATVE